MAFSEEDVKAAVSEAVAEADNDGPLREDLEREMRERGA